MFSSKLLLIALLLGAVYCERARYDNYQVHRLQPSTVQQLERIKNLEDVRLGYKFWTSPKRVDGAVDVMVPPHLRPQFREFLGHHGILSKVIIDNVQELIDQEESSRMKRPKAFGWTNYYNLEEINDWLSTLESANPKLVKKVVVGQTYEGRDMLGIEITFNSTNPGVYFESGIHAREWIGPAASSWIVNEILNSPTDSIWRRFNYVYVPSLNPDGYSYSTTDDRLWRKTRTPYDSIIGLCHGADGNRNWDMHWSEQGTSSFPCDETYGGPAAMSEVETQTLADYLLKVGSKYDIIVSFHSYSQLLMFPYGYTSAHAPHHDLWKRIGDLAAADLKAVSGLTYDVGNIYDIIYPASGSSMEWYYQIFNNTLAFEFETRDTGRYGFILPPEQIIPTAQELQAAIRRFLIEYEALKK